MKTLAALKEEFGYETLLPSEVALVRSGKFNWRTLDGEIICRKVLKSYPAYLQATNYGYKMTPYHYSLAANLQRDYERGPNPGMPYGLILLSASPQTGKSFTVTKSFQSWVLNKDPYKSVLTLGYEADFTKTFGRANRDKFAEFAHVFSRGKIKLHDKVQSTEDWETMVFNSGTGLWDSTGGGMHTAGMGGAITGKWFPNDMPVWTPKGWVKHGDLRVGDEVFGPDGKPKKVIKLWPKHQRQVYELVLDNGATVMECADQHEWPVTYQRKSKEGRTELRTYNVETRHIFDPHIPAYTKTGQFAGYNLSKERLLYRTPYIANIQPLEEPEKDLPIDPYLLGLWLGDGIGKTRDVCGLKEDLEVYKQYTPWPNQELRPCDNIYLLKVCERRDLGKLNLLQNKHIPAEYLHGSIAQRYALLQGIIDTDGHISARDGMVEIASANYNLSRDIQLLVRSLGYKLSVYIRDDGNARIAFWPFGNEVLARLPRKQQYVRPIKSTRVFRHFIKEVRCTDKIKEGNCIMVEGDGLYVAGTNLIATHNTGNVVVIDDPIKNMKEADSEVRVADNIEYFQSAIETRLLGNPGSLCIVMCTRWVINDLIGWLRRKRKKYIVGDYNYAAVCTPRNKATDPLGRELGEGICPEMGLDEKWAKNIEESYMQSEGAHVFNALFQGEPSDEMGNLFRTEDWQEYKIADLDLTTCDRVYLSIDATFKDNKVNDYVAMGVGAIKNGNDYKRYIVRKHLDLPDMLDKIIEVCKKFPEIDVIYIEDKANGPGAVSVLRKWRKKLNIDEANFPSIYPLNPEGGKYSRAQAVAPYQRDGRCYVPREADAHLFSSPDDFEWDDNMSYVQAFKHELGTFPFGANDDLVDMHSQSILKCIGLMTGEEKPTKKPVRFSRYSVWDDYMEDDYAKLETREERQAFIKMHGANIKWKPKKDTFGAIPI